MADETTATTAITTPPRKIEKSKTNLYIGLGAAGVGFLTLVGLRLHAMAKQKDANAAALASPNTPVTLPNGNVVNAPPVNSNTSIAQAAAAAQGLPIPPPGGPTLADLVTAIANPAATDVDLSQFTADQLQAAQDLLNAQNDAQVTDGVGSPAIVTTNDPPPSGDLIIRDGPSTTADQIGGAEKDGTVTVLTVLSNADFAKIHWNGGGRWPAVTGWVKKQFLVLQ